MTDTRPPARKKKIIRNPRPNEWSVALARAFAEALGSEALPPVLFKPLIEGAPFHPLKVGIREDLHAAYPDHDNAALGKALMRYCQSWDYLWALKNGKYRHDLADEPDKAISPAEREIAAKTLAARHKRIAARQQLDQAA